MFLEGKARAKKLNTLIQDGKEIASVLYTYRSCVKALPQGYVGIHSSGFRNFLLKPELLRSIVDYGFEHLSEGKVKQVVDVADGIGCCGAEVTLATG
ncbi:hypothetical protein GOBAR_AA13640 [Gossypium barbadense]|uniref:Uncharacterized protein n=1 Tax=Gossypium barbadense TaxID=3634 RepID=A0A2P5XUH3_GOSBA|nr:hypothetical protein GOBAR_AA13640 [Gossypium barbadense]